MMMMMMMMMTRTDDDDGDDDGGDVAAAAAAATIWISHASEQLGTVVGVAGWAWLNTQLGEAHGR